MTDDHAEHVAEHLAFRFAPPKQIVRPVEPRWRRWWYRLTFRPMTVTIDVRAMLDEHVAAHQRMMDEMSGVPDVSRGNTRQDG